MSEKPSHVLLAHLSSSEARTLAKKGVVVVVPVGALEQHGPHLPLGTDHLMAQTIAERAASLVSATPTTALVTPPVWCGFSPHHMEFPGTMSLRAETLTNLCVDIAKSLWTQGFTRILFLNGHGGNANILAACAQVLRFEHGVRVAVTNYWSLAMPEIAEWRHSEMGGINHACEMETSLMLATHPELCQVSAASDADVVLRSRFFSSDLTEFGAVVTPWSFDELSSDGTIGSPTCASAERGELLLEILVSKVADLLQEMSSWDWQDPLAIARGK